MKHTIASRTLYPIGLIFLAGAILGCPFLPPPPPEPTPSPAAPTSTPAATVVPTATPTPAGVQPAVPAKYLSYQNIAIHDPGSPQYRNDCITCHGDRANEVGLDGKTVAFHSTMKSVFSPAEGSGRCKTCHDSGVDLVSYSATGLRQQVDRAACAGCHGPGSAVPLYAASP